MINEFLQMGGYGFFVWTSFLIVFIFCSTLYYHTKKTLKKYEKEFAEELEKLPAKYLFSPWELSTQELDKYGVKLGYNYPNPMVDLKESRNKALSAFQTIRKQNV